MEGLIFFPVQISHRPFPLTVFGGFLMREAFELAWMSAYQLAGTVGGWQWHARGPSWQSSPNNGLFLFSFALQHPFFLSLDDISFRLPVAIGSVLKLTASVAYVPEGDSSAIQTDVEAEVVDPT
jgi:acyl-CoA hydrolase